MNAIDAIDAIVRFIFVTAMVMMGPIGSLAMNVKKLGEMDPSIVTIGIILTKPPVGHRPASFDGGPSVP